MKNQISNFTYWAIMTCLSMVVLCNAHEATAQCHDQGFHICKHRGRRITIRHDYHNSCHHNSCSHGNCNRNKEKPRPQAQMGLKGGLSFANFYTTNEELSDKNLRRAYHVGLTSRYPIIPNLVSLHADLLYSRKGISDAEVLNGVASANLDYIEVPVMAAFDIAKGVSIEGGVYGGYLLHADAEAPLQSFDINDFNTFDFGYVGGLGFRSNGLGFGIRYNYGIREVAVPSDMQMQFKNAKNSALQFYLVIGLD